MQSNIDQINGSWDPLAVASNTDAEILTAAKKREIKNILKSYVGTYDPMSELIQNAMDAVERRQNIDGTDFMPRLMICIDLQENSLQVIDNGCGFNREQFQAFLAPSISFKKDTTTRGNKGVGATYIAYGFNNLEIRTRNNEFEFSGRFRNGRNWVDDNSGTIHRPHVEPVNSEDLSFDLLQQGTSVKLIFGGKNTRPTSLAWYQAVTPEQWLYLLLIRTPLGHLNLPDGSASGIGFELTVVDAGGTRRCLTEVPARYKFPHDEIKASVRLKYVRNAQLHAISQARDPQKAIEKYRNSNGIYEFYDTADISRIRKFSTDEIELINQYNVTAYGYFAYSTAIWDQLNDVKANLRRGYRVIKGGLQMANNFMVQGELITIPLNKSTGHQNQTHVIVHFTGADPDLGRKGFQPELKALSENIAVSIVGQLSGRRDVLKGDSGETPDIEKEIQVHEWIREQELHEKEHPLSLNSEHFFLPTKSISIRSEPRSEQDVIVLFKQLIAGGVIRGIRLLSTSQISQYDGVFRYVAEAPLEHLVFDPVKNPLGVYEEQLTKVYQGPPRIIEYKFSLDGLIREFEARYKNEKDVALAVFWDFGKEY